MTWSIEEFAERVVRPGNGYGNGCTIVGRRVRVIAEVEFTLLRVRDNFTGERESIYLTEDGFKITPMYGEYGSGVRWGLTGTTPGAARFIERRDLSGVLSLSNLAGGARVVSEYRASGEGL